MKRNYFEDYLKKDPTMTSTIRNIFSSKIVSRYRYLKLMSIKSIYNNDCFGMKKRGMYSALDANSMISENSDRPEIDSWKSSVIPLEPRELADYDPASQVHEFLFWIEEMEKNLIFQTSAISYSEGGKYWYDYYISTAYMHGIAWARNRLKSDIGLLKALGLTRDELKSDSYSVAEAYRFPVNIERSKIIFERAKRDLDGISSALSTAISRTLANGFLVGRTRNQMSRDVAYLVSDIGEKRAALFAKSYIVRAHHIAVINEYRRAGIEKVFVKAEWLTAGDSRVCPLCKDMEGKIYTLSEIEPLIPLHPLCRCAAIPYIEKIENKLN